MNKADLVANLLSQTGQGSDSRSSIPVVVSFHEGSLVAKAQVSSRI